MIGASIKDKVMRVTTEEGTFKIVKSSKNLSFIKMAAELRQRNISGWYKLLEVKNPLVVLIDPFDPNLNADDKRRVMEEVKDNPWYYLREIAQVDIGDCVSPVVMLTNNMRPVEDIMEKARALADIKSWEVMQGWSRGKSVLQEKEMEGDIQSDDRTQRSEKSELPG